MKKLLAIISLSILFAQAPAFARYIEVEEGEYEQVPYNSPVNVLGSQTFGGPREKLGN